MLRSYLKIAIRNLLKNKVYSFINISGLAVGMAVAMLIGLWVYDELSFDTFHKNGDSIFRITNTQKQSAGIYQAAVTPGLLADALKKDFPQIEQTLRIGRQPALIQNGSHSLETDNIFVVDPSFFSMFDFPLKRGNVHKIFEGPNEIVLTERSAAILFGENWEKQDIIGKTLTVQSFQKFTLKISGIAKNLPKNSHLQSEVFLPFKFLEKYDEWGMKWNSNNFHTYLKLNPKTNIKNFESKLTTILKKYREEDGTRLYLQPLSAIYLNSKIFFQTDWGKRSDIFYVYLLVTVGLIVLLIAVFNFINLATARATQRGKEVGVRKVVGAGRLNLILQFLTEALLIVLCAMMLAITLVDIALPIFNQVAEKALPIPFFEPIFWIIITAFVLVMTLLSGIYPAFILSSYKPAKVLKGYFTINSGKSFRQFLVLSQLSLSIILTLCTLTIYKQLSYIQQKNLGFEKNHLMYVELKGDLKSKAILFKNEISKLSFISSASVATNNLVNVYNSSDIEWEGQTKKGDFLITQLNTDPDFIETVGAKIVAGRNFSNKIARDTSDKIGTYLLNETAAHKMGWTAQTAIGKKVKFWGFEGEVVGIIKDFHFKPLNTTIEPFIFRYRPKEFYFNILIKTKSQDLKQTIEQIAKIAKKYDPNYPLAYGFVNQDLEKQYANDQRTGQIILLFSILAIFISCLGLFGLVSFIAQQRTKEIGIRKIFGASVNSLWQLLSKDFMVLTLVSCAIAIPISFYLMNEWLKSYTYKAEISWWTFVLTSFGALLITLLTVSYQAIKAALMNPVESLKTE